MKKATKLLSLLLAGLLLASCSNAAGGQNETSPPDTVALPSSSESAVESESETTYIPDDLPDEDFGDYAFRILSCVFYNKELATYITYDELTGVPVDDALYNSKTNIEDRFKVGISWIETGNESAGLTAAKNAINAGDDAFDILIGHDTNTVGLGKSGLLRNMYDIDEFNFEKPWWPNNAVESWTVAGKMFAASSYISYCGIHWTRAMTVNKDWAEELLMEIPYEAVREGKWTLDMLNTLTEDVSYDVDGNGKMNDKDKVGFTSGTQTWYCLQEGVDLPVYLEGALKSRAADSADDTEMLQIIADTRTIGFAYGYGLQINNILGDILDNGQGAASYFKSKEKIAEKALNKMISNFEDMD